MILSCVRRIRDKLGYSVGAVLLLRTLRGSREQRVLELGLDTLPTFGLLKETPQAELQTYMDALEQAGYLYTDPTYRAVQTTEKAKEVLFRNQPVRVRIKQEPAPREARKTRPAEQPPQGDPALFDELRALRRELADAEGLAAYMVFSDASLRDMAAKKPRSEREFLNVSGVGEYKLRKYGKAFLRKIAQFQ